MIRLAKEQARQEARDRKITLDKLSAKEIERQIDAGLKEELKIISTSATVGKSGGKKK